MSRRGAPPMTQSLSALLVAATLLAGCSTQPSPHDHGSAAASPAVAPPLFDDLGRYNRAITTTSPRAQAFFDQGLRLVYGFNPYEAPAALPQAPRLDPAGPTVAW